MKATAGIIITMITETGNIIDLITKKMANNIEVRVFFGYYGLSIAKSMQH